MISYVLNKEKVLENDIQQLKYCIHCNYHYEAVGQKKIAANQNGF